MAKRIHENPTIADRITFDILTPDEFLTGSEAEPECFEVDPFRVDSITIYFLERGTSGGNINSIEKQRHIDYLVEEFETAKILACNDGSQEALDNLSRLRNELIRTAVPDPLYFQEAKVVAQFGTADSPAWLSTDPDNSILRHITTDDEGDSLYGHFELDWDPIGMREGDYIIKWTWSPYSVGDTHTNYKLFSLLGSTQITSLPSHFTKAGKYETLLERYLPSMFKMRLTEGDLSPEVLQEFNLSIAKGFKMVEDLANQLVDTIDANSTHEAILPLLSNLFALRLRSGDPTLWRRQIRRAVPLFKKKGTFGGLAEALSQAGIKLNRIARAWQVVSPYTFQEVLTVSSKGQTEFVLSYPTILPIESQNFELYKREFGGESWEELDDTYIEITNGPETILEWVHADQLHKGDQLRILYQIADVPSPSEQSRENYIRQLPLYDERDDLAQEYPLKNWNVRAIEEDDPLFDVIITTRHPYYDPVIFGKIRTEFPYSENIYNMDEYNGSKRDSTLPCHIDKNFIDKCSFCLGSKFTADVEIEKISNDRIVEAQEVIREFVPFHSLLHSLNVSGSIEEVIPPPTERITLLLKYSHFEITIADPPQNIFSRTMTKTSQLGREDLATTDVVIEGGTGTGKSDKIVLYCPDIKFDELPVDPEQSLVLVEVFAPSANAGDYQAHTPTGHHMTVEGVVEPFDQAGFAFRMSNERLRKASGVTITQDDLHILYDETINFMLTGVKSEYDVNNDPDYSGGAWRIVTNTWGGGPYKVLRVLPDGGILLEDDGTLPDSGESSISYTIEDDAPEAVKSSTSGRIKVKKRGRVDLSGTILYRGDTETISDLRDIISIGYYALVEDYDTQYLISGFVEGETHEFYIDNYAEENAVTTGGVVVYQRLTETETGFFSYFGRTIETDENYETSLGIQNGVNGDPDNMIEGNSFKENFLVVIDGTNYIISEIDGTTMKVTSHALEDWPIDGEPVTFDIIQFTKQPTSIPARTFPPVPGHDFEYVDRRGNDVFEIETESSLSMMSSEALDNNNGPSDIVNLGESIKFTIEYKDE
jgi:hypothetical protein